MTDVTVVAERPANPVAVFRQQVEARQNEFAAALPAHIPAERFVRVILTAVNKNPGLLYADRASLFSSAMMAAADGLLCDGREAALVIYRTKKKDDQGERWIEAVQYMPMVAGILKKVRNSGELSTIVAKVVYAGDHFRNWIDDQGEHLEYEAGENQDRNVVRNAFAMAKLKDGAVEVEVLKPADIEKIRSVSRAKDKGPWVDWWEEMAKKSAIRRLSKRLPLNTDLDDLIRRDDALYDFDGARADAQANQPRSLAGKLDALAGSTSLSPSIASDFDRQTGEVIESNSAASTTTGDKGDAAVAGQADPAPGPDKASPASNSASSQKDAHPGPSDASGQGAAKSDPSPDKDKAAPKAGDKAETPKNEAEYVTHARSWIEKLNDADAGEKQWASEKGLRNKSNTGADARETLQSALADKCREIRDADRS